MFERYTERARRVLFHARLFASTLGGAELESDHLLLAMLKEASGVSHEIFTRAALTQKAVRDLIRAQFPPREQRSTAVEIPFSADVRAILAAAEREADGLMHSYIGTEHLLLGALSQKESFAGRVLAERGLDLLALRPEIRARSSPNR